MLIHMLTQCSMNYPNLAVLALLLGLLARKAAGDADITRASCRDLAARDSAAGVPASPGVPVPASPPPLVLFAAARPIGLSSLVTGRDGV